MMNTSAHNHQPNKVLLQQQQEDVIIKIEPSIAASSTINTLKSNRIKYCSLVLKLVGLLIIVGIVLLFALLPNYLRNRNAEEAIHDNNTDPTNARLPGGA